MSDPWPDVVLIRHGEPADTVRGTFLGRTDPPLSTEGGDALRRTAEAVKGLLPAGPPRRLWTSGLRRAQESAAIVAGVLAVAGQVRIDRRLDECDFGEWDGLTTEAIEAIAPGGARAWLDDPVDRCGPDGETLRQVDERVGAWFEELRDGDGTPVLVVGHFGSLCCLAARLLDIPVERAVRLALNRARAGWIHGGRIRWWGMSGEM